MVVRWCAHCETEIEVMADARVTCPSCGLDPDVAPLACDDGAAFWMTDDSQLFGEAQLAR